MKDSKYVKLAFVTVPFLLFIGTGFLVDSCTSKRISYEADYNLPTEQALVVPDEVAPAEEQQKTEPKKPAKNTFFFTKSDSDVNAAVDTALDELVYAIGEFQKTLKK